jgi:hypothetical protein
MSFRTFPLALLVLCPGVGFAVEPAAPDRPKGLVAWYRAADLQPGLADGDPVSVWTDASGHGHDLIALAEAQRARLRAGRAGGKAVVELHTAETYKLEQPFELGDHTIFAVYRQRFSDRALFRSDLDPYRGVVLGQEQMLVYRAGPVGQQPTLPYTAPLPKSDGFRLAVLGRQGTRMRGFVDAADVSSMVQNPSPVRVGLFFQLTYSRQVDQDADGLELAELAIYDRFLADDERRAVTAELGRSYGLTLASEEGGSFRARMQAIAANTKAGVARLGRTSPLDVSAKEGAFVTWDREELVSTPWRRDADWPGRLYATADVPQAHAWIWLALGREQPGSSLRALLFKNGKERLPGEARIGSSGGFESRFALAAGDFVEVSVYPQGMGAPVELQPGESELLIEAE